MNKRPKYARVKKNQNDNFFSSTHLASPVWEHQVSKIALSVIQLLSLPFLWSPNSCLSGYLHGPNCVAIISSLLSAEGKGWIHMIISCTNAHIPFVLLVEVSHLDTASCKGGWDRKWLPAPQHTLRKWSDFRKNEQLLPCFLAISTVLKSSRCYASIIFVSWFPPSPHLHPGGLWGRGREATPSGAQGLLFALHSGITCGRLEDLMGYWRLNVSQLCVQGSTSSIIS